MRTLLRLLIVASIPVPVAAQAPGDGFFDSLEPIHLRIEADFEQLGDDRGQESEERPARAFLLADDGSEVEIPLQIRTRGRSRLRSSVCSFPPLRLNFPKSALEGTVLDGEDKLKLVTHCRDNDRYEQNVIQEYLVYRAYKVLTDVSFRVRLARMTYVDVKKPDERTERWGFLIESDDALAARHGGSIREEAQIHPARIPALHAGRVELFQYMIGNTDFSVYLRHNTEVVLTGDGELVPVPFDFDATGLISTPYAQPDEKLGLRSVEERMYRGICRPDLDYQALYQLFRDKRAEIEDVFRSEALLSDRERDDALEYIEDFYDTLDSERRSRDDIERSCRSIG